MWTQHTTSASGRTLLDDLGLRIPLVDHTLWVCLAIPFRKDYGDHRTLLAYRAPLSIRDRTNPAWRQSLQQLREQHQMEPQPETQKR